MSYIDNKKVTMLDFKSDIVRDQFKFCGNFKKRYLMLMLKINFPEYYINGSITGELEILVNHFSRKYTKKEVENPIFIGWNRGNDVENKTVTLLNIKLGGGASEFIEYVLENSIVPAWHVNSFKLGTFKIINDVYEKENMQADEHKASETTDTEEPALSKYVSRTESQFDD